MECRAYSSTGPRYILAKKSIRFFCAVLETALSSTCFEFCWTIFHHGLLLLLLYILVTGPQSLGQIDYRRNNPQKSVIQYIPAKHVTVSFESVMSLLRHNVGSTIPRLTALLIHHKRFVWRFYSRGLEMGWYRAPGTSQTSGKRRKAGGSNQAAKVEKISA